jgi:hypothetical protein
MGLRISGSRSPILRRKVAAKAAEPTGSNFLTCCLPTLYIFSMRYKRKLRSLGLALATSALVAGTIVWGTGDFGLTQRWLTGTEQRALAGRSTLADRWGLRVLYRGLQLGGQLTYPQAAGLLGHYLHGGGDTLRFDARPLLRHPEVQQALRQHRPGITFRHQAAGKSPFYVVAKTDWPLYYAFDLLYIKYEPTGVVFYDNYFFQPVARRSYARFGLGKVHLRLNDGLIHVAYPEARPFIVYGPTASHAPGLQVASR